MKTRKRFPKIQVNDIFGRWTVKSDYITKHIGKNMHPMRYRECRCECGNEKVVSELSLKNGSSLSCGCFNKEMSRIANTLHGETLNGKPTTEYTAWQAMNNRCRNPNNPRFNDYGGRGITICDQWREFSNFLADMGPKPTPKHQLDRIRNEEGYGPDNCRWATPAEQMVNRRNTRFVETDNGPVPLANLAKQSGIPANTLRARILKGWDLSRALSQPVGNTGPKSKTTP